MDQDQVDRIKEMDAYDALPPIVRDAFDSVPMKVSVYNTMRKPDFAKAYATMAPIEFARTVTQHFIVEAALNRQNDQLTTAS